VSSIEASANEIDTDELPPEQDDLIDQCDEIT
jgi:hypothetical protein